MLHYTYRNRFLFLAACLATSLLVACAKPQKAPPLPEVSIGVAAFTQPMQTADLLAGFLPEDTPRVNDLTKTELDAIFSDVLLKKTSRRYVDVSRYALCRDAEPAVKSSTGRTAAMHYWTAVGRCMNVDFLLVPHIIEFRERDGGEAGVISPAKVLMDIFLIDTRNSVLIGRSHYDETQHALSENLLEAGKFVSRGGKWVTAGQLAREGMEKAVEELGL